MSAAPATAPMTVTSALEQIWADAGAPILIGALNSVIPGISAIFKIPIIGQFLTYLLNTVVDKLIVAGVIEIKIGIISFMSAEAQTKWASELTILKQVHAAGKTLTPEQQAEYDKALQDIVKSHSSVVSA